MNSEPTSVVSRLHLVDYVIFGATLSVSVLIGVYYAVRHGGQKTTNEFLLGDRRMPVLPTALSLMVSFQSGILILGVSSEMYVKGTHMAFYLIGLLLGIPMAAVLYLPIFYKLKLTSAYEYLELRFQSQLVRKLGSAFFIVSTLMYMAIVLYAPAIALSGVSGISLEVLILISGISCTFYTSLGGLKAVVWTDAFQAIVMYSGFIMIIWQGVLKVGGVGRVWQLASEGGRLLVDFNPNPFMYMNFWTVVMGTMIGWMSIYGTTQTSVQRYTSLDNLSKARWSLLLSVPGLITMVPMVIICGIVMYAYYAKCDPMKLGFIRSRDQLLPYFSVDVLGDIKGVPGVFMACLYSGTLSTVSSGLNSLSAVVWEDFLKPHLAHKITDLQATKLTKIIAMLFGVTAIALAFVAQHLGGVLQAAMTVLQAVGAPVAGMFLLGIVVPWANTAGAVAGATASAVIMSWISLGAQIVKPYQDTLPQSVVGCDQMTLFAAGLIKSLGNGTFTPFDVTSVDVTSAQNIELTGIEYMYKLSYKVYGLTGILIVFAVGIPVSLITGRCRLKVGTAALVWAPLRRLCFPCLPKYYRVAIWDANRDRLQTATMTDKPTVVYSVDGQRKQRQSHGNATTNGQKRQANGFNLSVTTV